MHRTLRISSVLVAGVLLVIGSMVVAVVLTTRTVSREVIESQVERLITEDTEDVVVQVSNLVSSAESLVAITAKTWGSPAVAGSDRSWMITLLRSDPAFQGLFVGRPDGSFTFVTDHERGTRIKEIVVAPRVVTNTIVDADGTVIDSSTDPEDAYDPTVRPWYSLAVDRDGIAWTDPYIFFDSQEPGLTVATPLSAEVDDGVVGLDLSARSLSTFLFGLGTSENSVAVILDERGQVLAFSDPDAAVMTDDDGMRLSELVELDTPAVAAAAADFLSSGRAERYSTLDSDGVTYLAAFRAVDPDLGWSVGVVAPEDDYLGAINTSERNLTGLVVIIGAMAIISALVLTRMISRPLERMRQRAQALLAGERIGERGVARFQEIEAADQAMYLVQERLEARVHERTMALEAEVEHRRAAELAAEQASRAKSEFLARVSHELRTPLTAIIGFTSVLEDVLGSTDNDPDIARTALASIESSAGHLLELINDILDVARIESGNETINEELIDVEPLFADVEGMLSGMAQERDVSITRVVPASTPAVMGDDRRLRQVLINLAGNAVKFTPAGGDVELRASIDHDGGMLLEVVDTGAGMTGEQIADAMTLFGQVRDSDYTQAGTGLGLNLAQELTELHGGRLSLSSVPGEGTTASVWLPPHRVFNPSRGLTPRVPQRRGKRSDLPIGDDN